MARLSFKIPSSLGVLVAVLLVVRPLYAAPLHIPGNTPSRSLSQAPIVFRPLYDPPPGVALNVPADVPIGGTFSFGIDFSTTTTGYGPFIDIILPRNGADGAMNTDTPDGITFVSVTYLGIPLSAQVFTFPGSGGVTCVNHPYAVDNTGAPLQVCGPAGDQLIVAQLPFGSFVPEQSPATVNVTANVSGLADAGFPLPIRARVGFMFGNDPLNNPTIDPSVVSSFQDASATPNVLLGASKAYIGPEDETATGPNFVRRYAVNADIASGQIFNAFTLTDNLPNTLAYLGNLSGSPVPYTIVDQPPLGVAQNPPNNDVVVRWEPLNVDPGYQFDFHVPFTDANGLPVLNPLTGASRNTSNEVRAIGEWVPSDPRDPPTLVTRTVTNAHTLEAQSIAIQKSSTIVTDVGAPGTSPGDVLEYRLDFQVSDFFAFSNVIISDTLGDGQRLTTTFTPTLSINGNGYSLSAAPFNPLNYGVHCNYTAPGPECETGGPPLSGTTQISFFVSLEQALRGQGLRLIGGCVHPLAGSTMPNCNTYNDGPTTGQIRFRAVILDAFSDDYPSGDPSVDGGDLLYNLATIAGDVLTTTVSFLPTGSTAGDNTANTRNVVEDRPDKTIYAVNGVVCDPQPCTDVRVSPGYSITFRILVPLLNSDYESAIITDFLPLPVLNATTLTAFDPTISAAPPPVGQAKFGPSETLYTNLGIVPTMTTNAAQNSVTFNWGTFDDPLNRSAGMDVLFTVEVNDQPFADGLILTNQIRGSRSSTNQGSIQVDDIVSFTLDEPNVRIIKGIVAASNPVVQFDPLPVGPVTFASPGSTCPRFTPTIHSVNLITDPVDSNVSHADAGDLLTFAVVMENVGHASAFDVRLRDALPAGLAVPSGGPNLCVHYGDGTAIPYTVLGGGLFDPAGGIELTDPSPLQGALAAGQDATDALTTTGRNLAVVTFDLVVSPTIALSAVLTNTAVLSRYAGAEGAPNHLSETRSDVALVNPVAHPILGKLLGGSEWVNAYNGDAQVVIGELITYTLTVTLPEGVLHNARITDTLDAGLAFVEVLAVTTSPNLQVQNTIGTGATPANVTVSGDGRTIVFNTGTMTNTSSTTGTVPAQITISYQAVVLNVIGNQLFTALNNAAQLGWSNGLTSTAAPDVTVIEPAMFLTKAATPTSGDAGDLVTFTLTINNPSANSALAYDVVLSDVVPAGLVYEPGTWVALGGLAPSTLSDAAAPTLTATWDVFTPGQSSTLRFSARISEGVFPGQIITNTVRGFWSSLPGDPGQRSVHNAAATERNGSGGVVNDYTANAASAVTVTDLSVRKSLVATSEGHTSGSSIAIGEIARYRLVIQVPEASVPDLRILDFVPTGMSFLDDGSARCAFVANTVITSTALPTVTAVACPLITSTLSVVQASDPNILPSALITGTFADDNISANATTDNDTYTDSTDVYFKFGNVANGDSDSNDEFIIVEMNLLMRNAAGNAAGATRGNSFQVRAEGSPLVTSSNVNVTVVEPRLTIQKSVTPTVGDYSSLLTYTLFVSGTGGVTRTTAHDVVITDVLPAGLLMNGSSVISSSASPSGCASPIAHTTDGNILTVTVGAHPVNCGLYITFTAQLTNVLPGQALTNSAGVLYTSLPLTGTSDNPTGSNTPGATGVVTGERVYTGNAGATMTSDTPEIGKALLSTDQAHTAGSNLVVGEVLTYLLTITLPETDIPSLVISDVLPGGLSVLDTQVFTDSFDGQIDSADPTVTVAGTTVTFNFANPISVTVDGDPADNVITFTIRAVVSNVLSNQANVVLSNTATARVASQPPQTTSPVTTTIREPELRLTKQSGPALPLFGQTVYFTLTLSHATTSTVNAFDVLITDTLPAGLVYVPGSAAFSGGSVDESIYPPTLAFTRAALALGDVATMTYQALVSTPPTVTVGSLLTNTARAQWTSTPGSNPNERNGSGGVND